jgi:hypothetical protein
MLVVGLTMACCPLLSAQEQAKSQVQATVLQALAAKLNQGNLKNATPRLFAPEPLGFVIDGVRRKAVSVAARPGGEIAEFSRLLGAQIATPSDTIYCKGGACYGTRGVQIRIGNPMITADSAVVLYEILIRGPGEPGFPTRDGLFALFLKKAGDGWCVTKEVPAQTMTINPGVPARSCSGS